MQSRESSRDQPQVSFLKLYRPRAGVVFKRPVAACTPAAFGGAYRVLISRAGLICKKINGSKL